MVKIFGRLVLIAGVFGVMACAHEEKPQTAQVKEDTYEVSASGGDDKMLRSTAGQETATVLTGSLKMRGGKKNPGSIDLQLLDQDGTIYARTKTASDGSFVLSGSVTPGTYTVKVVAPKYRGELGVTVDKPNIKNLVVPVELK